VALAAAAATTCCRWRHGAAAAWRRACRPAKAAGRRATPVPEVMLQHGRAERAGWIAQDIVSVCGHRRAPRNLNCRPTSNPRPVNPCRSRNVRPVEPSG
jgi:hypothetical protein